MLIHHVVQATNCSCIDIKSAFKVAIAVCQSGKEDKDLLLRHVELLYAWITKPEVKNKVSATLASNEANIAVDLKNDESFRQQCNLIINTIEKCNKGNVEKVSSEPMNVDEQNDDCPTDAKEDSLPLSEFAKNICTLFPEMYMKCMVEKALLVTALPIEPSVPVLQTMIKPMGQPSPRIGY